MVSGRRTIDGVLFISYRTGISRYAWISEDGQIFVSGISDFRETLYAAVIGHGIIKGKSGNTKRFRSQESGAAEAIKIFRKLQAERAK